MDRLDEALRPAVVAERLPRRLHAAGDRGLGDDAAVPDLLDDLLFGHEALAVRHQQREEREDLRLQADGLAARAQLGRLEVELEASNR